MKPAPKYDKNVPWCKRECPRFGDGCNPAGITKLCLPQVELDEAELAQLRACHEAELGVCQQHCDIVQKSEQEIRRLERLVEKGVPPGPPDPPRPLVRKDFG